MTLIELNSTIKDSLNKAQKDISKKIEEIKNSSQEGIDDNHQIDKKTTKLINVQLEYIVTLKELRDMINNSLDEERENLVDITGKFEEASQEVIESQFAIETLEKLRSMINGYLAEQCENLAQMLREFEKPSQDVTEVDLEVDSEVEEVIADESDEDDLVQLFDSDLEKTEKGVKVEGVEKSQFTNKKVKTEESKEVVAEDEKKRMEESEEYENDGEEEDFIEPFHDDEEALKSTLNETIVTVKVVEESDSSVEKVSEILTDLAEGLDNERLTESEMVDDVETGEAEEDGEYEEYEEYEEEGEYLGM